MIELLVDLHRAATVAGLMGQIQPIYDKAEDKAEALPFPHPGTGGERRRHLKLGWQLAPHDLELSGRRDTTFSGSAFGSLAPSRIRRNALVAYRIRKMPNTMPWRTATVAGVRSISAIHACISLGRIGGRRALDRRGAVSGSLRAPPSLPGAPVVYATPPRGRER